MAGGLSPRKARAGGVIGHGVLAAHVASVAPTCLTLAAWAAAFGWAGLAPAAADSARAEPGCPATGTQNVRLVDVEARLELRLGDGRLLRLAGVDPALSTPAVPDRGDEAREALSRRLAGALLSIVPTGGARDRWGRIPVFAFTAGPGVAAQDQPGGVASLVIEAGLGRYLAEPAAHDCRAALIAAEARARTQKLGLWADPYYAVLTADDQAGFAERTGTLVVAEGRVERIETGPARAKLIFAGDPAGRLPNSHADPLANSQTHSHANSRGGQLLSATLLPRTIKILEAHGVTISSLSGRWVRIRGLLDTRFGPEIELLGPDDLDVLDTAPGPQ